MAEAMADFPAEGFADSSPDGHPGSTPETKAKTKKRLREKTSKLGPCVVCGAADGDPCQCTGAIAKWAESPQAQYEDLEGNLSPWMRMKKVGDKIFLGCFLCANYGPLGEDGKRIFSGMGKFPRFCFEVAHLPH